MANPLIETIQQVLVKIQAVPGTFQADMAAADGKIRLYYGKFLDFQSQKNARNIARDSLTPFGSLGGTEGLAGQLQTELNTPDTMTNSVEQKPLLLASAHTVTQARRIGIGAITGGPILRNATVTGGTSGGTGRVWRRHVSGEAFLYYVPVTGTLQTGETLTFSGGASATSSSAPSVWGESIKPSNPSSVVSIEHQVNGYAWSGRDMMASMSIEAENAKQAFMNFDLMGVKNVFGAKALTTGVSFDTEDPPVMYAAGLLLGTFAPVFSKWSFAQGAKLVLRENANVADLTGLMGAWIQGRDPKIKVTYEHVLESDFDVYGLYKNNTKFAFQAVVGQVASKQVWHFADEAQIAEPPAISAKDGFVMADLTLACTGSTSNSEYETVIA